MSLSIEDVQRVAHLARIHVTDAEAADVKTKLGGLFHLIEQMRAERDSIGGIAVCLAGQLAAFDRDFGRQRLDENARRG